LGDDSSTHFLDEPHSVFAVTISFCQDYAMDCPETGQDFGSRAKNVTSELAFGKVVTVHPSRKDRYGRTVADVILPDGSILNHELVRRGAAWWYRKVRRITA
jgi:endonuclease YncB( thermonuclease family)